MVFTNFKNSHSEFASLPLYSKVLHGSVTETLTLQKSS